jgi:hypothetical protein
MLWLSWRGGGVWHSAALSGSSLTLGRSFGTRCSAIKVLRLLRLSKFFRLLHEKLGDYAQVGSCPMRRRPPTRVVRASERASERACWCARECACAVRAPLRALLHLRHDCPLVGPSAPFCSAPPWPGFLAICSSWSAARVQPCRFGCICFFIEIQLPKLTQGDEPAADAADDEAWQSSARQKTLTSDALQGNSRIKAP